MFSVRTDIAVARLAKGYDAASARHLVINIVGLPNVSALTSTTPTPRSAMRWNAAAPATNCASSARVSARGRSHDYRPYKSKFYAARATITCARATANPPRIGQASIALLPDLIRAYGYFTRPERNDPAAKAIAMRGVGTDAVIALYRAGAIDDALNTHYLTSKDRYLNAERAGEKKDPLWMLEVHWPEYFDLVAREAARSNDREFQQRVYDGLVRSCGKPLADCFDRRCAISRW